MKVANDILIPELARLIGEGKEVRFTPSGVSMRPFIEGDKESVILAPVQTPRVGDILLAQVTNTQSPIYVLHRLIRIDQRQALSRNDQRPTTNDQSPLYILQGDGNLQGEEQCTRANIFGVVTHIETPRGRRKPLTRGRLWHYLFPCRRFLLKIYRHTWLKWCY